MVVHDDSNIVLWYAAGWLTVSAALYTFAGMGAWQAILIAFVTAIFWVWPIIGIASYWQERRRRKEREEIMRRHGR